MRYDQVGFNLSEYDDKTVSYSFLTSTDWSGASVSTKITCKSAKHTIYIMRIQLSVTTDNAATQQWQDSATTPIPVAKSKASPGLGPILWDFGPNGFALTEGKDLQHLMSATGMAGAVVVTAYQKKTAS